MINGRVIAQCETDTVILLQTTSVVLGQLDSTASLASAIPYIMNLALMIYQSIISRSHDGRVLLSQ